MIGDGRPTAPRSRLPRARGRARSRTTARRSGRRRRRTGPAPERWICAKMPWQLVDRPDPEQRKRPAANLTRTVSLAPIPPSDPAIILITVHEPWDRSVTGAGPGLTALREGRRKGSPRPGHDQETFPARSRRPPCPSVAIAAAAAPSSSDQRRSFLPDRGNQRLRCSPRQAASCAIERRSEPRRASRRRRGQRARAGQARGTVRGGKPVNHAYAASLRDRRSGG